MQVHHQRKLILSSILWLKNRIVALITRIFGCGLLHLDGSSTTCDGERVSTMRQQAMPQRIPNQLLHLSRWPFPTLILPPSPLHHSRSRLHFINNHLASPVPAPVVTKPLRGKTIYNRSWTIKSYTFCFLFFVLADYKSFFINMFKSSLQVHLIMTLSQIFQY